MCVNRIQISGNIPLRGSVTIQGCKNAALPLMAAAVLHEGVTVLHHCPRILDVEYMCRLLKSMGCEVFWENDSLTIDAKEIKDSRIREPEASCFRASVLLLGSLLGRFGCAALPYPGGCSIGKRPIDFHLQAFETLGASVLPEKKEIRLQSEKLCGREINFDFPSVGATENAILAAVLARGTTVIHGCAREPEIAELCQFLNEKGADIRGIGGKSLKIHGVKRLCDSQYTLMADRIVAGTYLLAVAGTGGTAVLKRASLAHLRALEEVLIRNGAILTERPDGVQIDAERMKRAREQICTAPYPGFPTDLQSQLIAFFCGTESKAIVEERMFESRFQAVRELQKMGADIRVDGRTAYIEGQKNRLHGASVCAYDLRGGAALVTAGIMAQGETYVSGCEFIRRGYEDISRDFALLGANIQEVDGSCTAAGR